MFYIPINMTSILRFIGFSASISDDKLGSKRSELPTIIYFTRFGNDFRISN